MTNWNQIQSKAGAVTFRSSDSHLNDGFNWAKHQAMAYAHSGGDSVGLWYEAALPSRQAFCMRDVAHHSIGAAILGLNLHTKNMFMRFAENIAESRDWCTYWEITNDNKPAEVDYANDQDFWYNLPANFDIIDASYRQYLWTGDQDYLNDTIMLDFYRLTVENYVQTWDKDGDGILEYYPEYGRRGLASYNEVGLQPLAGGDMIASQAAGYRAYAHLLGLRGQLEESAAYARKAQDLEQRYDKEWWNEEKGRFFGAILQNRTFLEEYNAEGNFLPLYFGVIKDKIKLHKALEDLKRNRVANVEGKTYLPDIFYRYDHNDFAFSILNQLIDPELERREYPEVSYCVIGSMAAGLMGISADGQSTISTLSRLSHSLEWAMMSDIPILKRTISVNHIGNKETSVTNHAGETVFWKAIFNSDTDILIHNDKEVKAEKEIAETGEVKSFIVIEVAEGETHLVSLR